MSKVKIGRPKGKSILTKEVILTHALALLDENGPREFSMRTLASRLKVTPMALYNHFPERSALLRSVSDMIYSEVTKAYESFSGSSKERLEFLLVKYHEAVIHHPNLSICIFEDSNVFSPEVQKITKNIMELLSEEKIEKMKKNMWLDILVDFTHGSAIATALNLLNKAEKRSIKSESLRYKKELRMLLDVIV